MGMGVPAKEMKLSLFDGAAHQYQCVGQYCKGESYFFNEVQRIKNTIHKINDGKNGW
jgi:DNA mismatch repair ATPase MutS